MSSYADITLAGQPTFIKKTNNLGSFKRDKVEVRWRGLNLVSGPLKGLIYYCHRKYSVEVVVES
jgi:hypothetical protein